MKDIASTRGDSRLILIMLLAIPFLVFLCQVSIAHGAFYSLTIIFSLVVLVITLIKTEWALVVLIFATLLSPEINVGETATRAVTIRVEDILMLVISFTWLAKMAIIKEIGFIRQSPLNGAIKVYAAICIVATLLGILYGNVYPLKGMFYLLKYLQYFILFYLVLNNVQSKEDLRLLMYSFFIVCFIISIYSLFFVGEVYRISAPFEGDVGEPNTFGGYLMFMFAISLALFLYSDSFQKSLFFGLLAALAAFVMLFTLSRGSYLGTFVVLLVLVVFTQYRRMLLVLGGLLSIASILIFPSTFKNRILYTFSFWSPEITKKTVSAFGIQFDPSSSARIESWSWAWQGWLDRPLLGHGVSGRGLIDNQFFTVLVETGILGLCAFIFLMWKIGKLGFTSFKSEQNRFYKGLFLGYFAGFIGLLFHSFTANTFIIIRIMEPFWFITGVMVVLPEIENRELLVKAERAP